MVCLESEPPSSKSQDHPWLFGFPLYRFQREAKVLRFRAQRVSQVLQARAQKHKVEHHLIVFQLMQKPSQVHLHEAPAHVDEYTLWTQSINDFSVYDVLLFLLSVCCAQQPAFDS